MQYTENNLDSKTADIARALKSLQEELEAINFYHQRVDVASDPELREIMAHNRDEEIEHSCMLVEWLRRNMNAWNDDMKTYFFTSKPLTEVEEDAAGGEGGGSSKGDGDLGIRKMA